MFNYMQIRNVIGTLQKRSVIALLVVAAFLATCFTGIAFFSNAAYITDGENTQFIFTSEGDPMSILAANGYTVGEYDKVSVNSTASDILNIQIARAVPVVINNNSETVSYMTAEKTVGLFLDSIGINLGEGDELNCDKDAKITAHMAITITHLPVLTIVCDGATIEVKAHVGSTVADILSNSGIVLSDTDKIDCDTSAVITENTTVTIIRVTTGEVTITSDIPYTSKTVKSSAYVAGTTKVTTAGVNGTKETVKKVTYEDGIAVSEEVISERVATAPVNEIISLGTSKNIVAANASTVAAVASPVSINKTNVISPAPADVQLDANGVPVSYSKVITGKTSAYTSPTGAHVSCGQVANIGLVAVDPKIIPYGTRMYIVANDGTPYGYAVAADTGGALWSGKVLIDLYMGANNDSVCYQWGIRNATIYVLD